MDKRYFLTSFNFCWDTKRGRLERLADVNPKDVDVPWFFSLDFNAPLSARCPTFLGCFPRNFKGDLLNGNDNPFGLEVQNQIIYGDPEINFLDFGSFTVTFLDCELSNFNFVLAFDDNRIRIDQVEANRLYLQADVNGKTISSFDVFCFHILDPYGYICQTHEAASKLWYFGVRTGMHVRYKDYYYGDFTIVVIGFVVLLLDKNNEIDSVCVRHSCHCGVEYVASGRRPLTLTVQDVIWSRDIIRWNKMRMLLS